jgi:hypothetical protein
MSDYEEEVQELQPLGKQKRKITQKQLEAGLNNLKKGPKQIVQNSIEKNENENIAYNNNDYYSAIEKDLNQYNQPIIEKKEKKKKNNTDKKLIERLELLENQVKSTNDVMIEMMNYKKKKMEKLKEKSKDKSKDINKNILKNENKTENNKLSNIERFILLQKSIKKKI